LEDPFEEMEQFEKRMNNLFKNLDKNFSNQFEINITPKS
jgi:outer membrane receptor for ferric coprogen and ferric-rhodotorulic acid